MAARRGKSQARRSSARQSGMPGWAWLLIGVLLTIVVILLAPRFIGAYKEGNTGFFSIGNDNTASTPEPLPQPDASSTPAFEPAPATPPKRQPQSAPAHQAPPKTRDFDFYEVLPNEEVALTDAQLAAIQREETRRREAARRREQADAAASQTPAPSPATTSDSAAAQAADAQARAAAAAANAQLPRPLPEAAVPARRAATPAPTPTAAATPAAKAAANTATQTVARSAPYIVQAGAFAASGDAEAAKARIALLGLNARVESAQINGKTVYRVRMGPYGSAAEAAAAKQKLEGGGVQAMTLQVK